MTYRGDTAPIRPEERFDEDDRPLQDPPLDFRLEPPEERDAHFDEDDDPRDDARGLRAGSLERRGAGDEARGDGEDDEDREEDEPRETPQPDGTG